MRSRFSPDLQGKAISIHRSLKHPAQKTSQLWQTTLSSLAFSHISPNHTTTTKNLINSVFKIQSATENKVHLSHPQIRRYIQRKSHFANEPVSYML